MNESVKVMDEEKEIKLLDRDVSWLMFNNRVLDQVMVNHHPIGERARFMSIFQMNLDEFLSIRGQHIENERLNKLLNEMVLAEVRKSYDKIRSDLFDIGVHIIPYEECSSSIRAAIEKQNILEPFMYLWPFYSRGLENYHPVLLSGNTNILAINDDNTVAIASLTHDEANQLIPIEDARTNGKSAKYYMTLTDLMRVAAEKLFPDASHIVQFRTIHYGDIEYPSGWENDTARGIVTQYITNRSTQKDGIVLFRCGATEEDSVRTILSELQQIPESGVIRFLSMPLDFRFLNNLKGISDKIEYYNPIAPIPIIGKGKSMIKAVEKKDILLAFPYHSMLNVVRLIEEAAESPNVASIKITLYRTANDSRIISALVRAAENGKDITVMMELRARFDEQHNLECTEILENAGCHVIHGISGYKVHSKIMVITYFSNKKLKRIAYIGTGNFNETSSNVYTDLGLLTADRNIALEIDDVFKRLMNNKFPVRMDYVLAAPRPSGMRHQLSALIEREIRYHEKHPDEDTYIYLKLNALTDELLIRDLIRAAENGIPVYLHVRGICRMISDRKLPITIFSTVGRYLEHSRIYSFGAGKRQKLYIGSADWMERNIDNRVEVAVEIRDKSIKKKINKMVNYYLDDRINSYVMETLKPVPECQEGVSYDPRRVVAEKTQERFKIDSQMKLYDLLK